MKQQYLINYDRIAKAIAFINTHHKHQPGLDQIAEAVNLSPFHFQRLFSDWAGVSPKKFLQYISINHAKYILKGPGATLFDATEATGLSGTSRLHDLFISIEGMTPGEFKNGGENLLISYSMVSSPFGALFAASTGKGLCHLVFAETLEEGLRSLASQFPKAPMQEVYTQVHEALQSYFVPHTQAPPSIRLHLKGSPFQLKVWQALLQIAPGRLTTYGHIANSIKQPTASRAVGTAIGSNPVAYLIPCHRVIQATGAIGGYRWGPNRKQAMIGWEAALQREDYGN